MTTASLRSPEADHRGISCRVSVVGTVVFLKLADLGEAVIVSTPPDPALKRVVVS